MIAPLRHRLAFSLRAMFVLVALGAVASQQWSRYADGAKPIEWRRFSQQTLKLETASGRNVLVSFMAYWDLTSAMQHKFIDTPPIRRLLRAKGMATLQADWTDGLNLDIPVELKALGQNSVPLLVIYPASGSTPIVLNSGTVGSEELATAIDKL